MDRVWLECDHTEAIVFGTADAVCCFVHIIVVNIVVIGMPWGEPLIA